MHTWMFSVETTFSELFLDFHEIQMQLGGLLNCGRVLLVLPVTHSLSSRHLLQLVRYPVNKQERIRLDQRRRQWEVRVAKGLVLYRMVLIAWYIRKNSVGRPGPNQL